MRAGAVHRRQHSYVEFYRAIESMPKSFDFNSYSSIFILPSPTLLSLYHQPRLYCFYITNFDYCVFISPTPTPIPLYGTIKI